MATDEEASETDSLPAGLAVAADFQWPLLRLAGSSREAVRYLRRGREDPSAEEGAGVRVQFSNFVVADTLRRINYVRVCLERMAFDQALPDIMFALAIAIGGGRRRTSGAARACAIISRFMVRPPALGGRRVKRSPGLPTIENFDNLPRIVYHRLGLAEIDARAALVSNGNTDGIYSDDGDSDDAEVGSGTTECAAVKCCSEDWCDVLFNVLFLSFLW
jgi:hypothetical protein